MLFQIAWEKSIKSWCVQLCQYWLLSDCGQFLKLERPDCATDNLYGHAQLGSYWYWIDIDLLWDIWNCAIRTRHQRPRSGFEIHISNMWNMWHGHKPDICQFWYTTALFWPVKIWSKLATIGQNIVLSMLKSIHSWKSTPLSVVTVVTNISYVWKEHWWIMASANCTDIII